MKKLLHITILIFSFFQNDAFSENILLLTNLQSREISVLHVGSYLVFELKSDKSIHEGFIREIRDSSMVFDDSQVSLSQITVLAGSTKINAVTGKAVKGVGRTLICSGADVVNFGLDVIVYTDFCLWPIGGAISLTGAFISGLGHMFKLAASSPGQADAVRSYSGWEVSIINKEHTRRISEKQILPLKDSIQIAPVPRKNQKEKKGKIYGDDVYSE